MLRSSENVTFYATYFTNRHQAAIVSNRGLILKKILNSNKKEESIEDFK